MSELTHYGTPRRSGRYPWGSGSDPYQNNMNFLSYMDDLRAKGLSEAEIAKDAGISIAQLRDRRSIAVNAKRAADAAMIQRLKDKGMSNVEIGKRMGIGESTVRSLLKEGVVERARTDQITADMLKARLEETGGYLDVGTGTERYLGISDTKLRASVLLLEEQGYKVHNIPIDQLGTGEKTITKVLVPPGVEWVEAVNNKDKIRLPFAYTEDDGETYKVIQPPVSINSKRLAINYDETGGGEKDGLIELRRDADDLSLGGSRYAQVRIAVDGTHYIKGVAVYADDLPPGVDIRFNTNKSNTGNKKDALKVMEDDPDYPFGSVVRQKDYFDKNGKPQLSPLNIVNEEGSWEGWSKSLSSQMLSKQTPALVKEQLGKAFDLKKAEYDEIMSLTNPVVK